MTNEAAERLRDLLSGYGTDALEALDAALAVERVATVERIRAALHERNLRRRSWDIADAWEVLDAEAVPPY